MNIKKTAAGIIIGLAMGVFSMISAIEISSGVGGFFSNSFDGGNKSDILYESIKDSWMGGGFNIFLDAAYAELNLGITFGNNVWETLIRNSYDWDDDDCYYSKWDTNFSTFKALNISLLVKYPFSLRENISLFPMAGIEYHWHLSEKQRGINIEYWDDPSRLWFKFGAGTDYNITDKIYIRHALLYGIGLSSKAERYARESFSWFYDDIRFKLHHGFTFKAGIGYKF